MVSKYLFRQFIGVNVICFTEFNLSLNLFLGLTSEGIYRKSGSENSIQTLLKQFRSDAHSVQINQNDYTEHDVANVLKRFMCDMPDRLLTRFSLGFIFASKKIDDREKIKAYKEVLARLSSVEYNTLRKIVRHLHFIQSQQEQNKMDYSNLAIVWGPILSQKQDIYEHTGHLITCTDVIIDLIQLHEHLFEWSDEEIIKEKLILENLKRSQNVKILITVDKIPENPKEEKTQIKVTLTPTKTVNDIFNELAPKINLNSHAPNVIQLLRCN